jgi:DNA-binding HxlR family transcriptional regulator
MCRPVDWPRVLQGKWKLRILNAMRNGPIRLGQLARELPTVSKKVLTENLRELEQSKVIVRRDLSGTVRHVEYDFADGVRQEIHLMLDHLVSFGSAISALSSDSSEDD